MVIEGLIVPPGWAPVPAKGRTRRLAMQVLAGGVEPPAEEPGESAGWEVEELDVPLRRAELPRYRELRQRWESQGSLEWEEAFELLGCLRRRVRKQARDLEQALAAGAEEEELRAVALDLALCREDVARLIAGDDAPEPQYADPAEVRLEPPAYGPLMLTFPSTSTCRPPGCRQTRAGRRRVPRCRSRKPGSPCSPTTTGAPTATGLSWRCATWPVRRGRPQVGAQLIAGQGDRAVAEHVLDDLRVRAQGEKDRSCRGSCAVCVGHSR